MRWMGWILSINYKKNKKIKKKTDKKYQQINGEMRGNARKIANNTY